MSRRFLGVLAAGTLAACGSDPPAGPTGTPTPTPAPSTPPVTLKIMPLGDSITQGDAQHDSYRRPLWRALQSGGYRVDFVGSQSTNHRGPAPSSDFDLDHEGHWGLRADEVLDGLPAWADATRPDIVLVHLGSNDVFERQSTGSTLSDLSAIVDVLRGANPRVTVLVAQIIPTRDRESNDGIDDLNAAIPSFAASRSTGASPLLVVDQFTGFDARADTYDGVHPTAAGEAKLASKWLDALQPLLRGSAAGDRLSTRMLASSRGARHRAPWRPLIVFPRRLASSIARDPRSRD